MDLSSKLAILADAAKYDASCASSGTKQRDSTGGRGIGSTEGAGICHSYAPDGRCISLLKILLTNHCQYDCLYCINRASSNVPRARFRVDEVVQLTLDFYRRNCIEGLFLSSGIVKSPDYTMEQVVEVARALREDHDFRGYIHLKTIPDASDELIARAGLYADRLSINVELPTSDGLQALAPEKNAGAIRRSMAGLRIRIDAAKEERQDAASIRALPGAAPRAAAPPRFAPAGQSTQMIVGADATDDRGILAASANLYGAYRLRRVYYSAFSPIPDAAKALPLRAPPLIREHRLYQADWLMRFYGFEHHEIVAEPDGLLRLDVDPKLAWALAHEAQFPVDLNRAPREMLLRVPGLGGKAVARLLQARRVRRLRAEDLQRLHVPARKVLPFVLVDGHRPAPRAFAAEAQRVRAQPLQEVLF
ncbi:putative DNA modification/repair radical SAM protein [Variovorax sp. J22P168]|uniref:putative DNA modification/repair radical SAM protein n=1 Tax=Variovorax jilinensis TaxID=3053513 RepID=UPI002575F719|nr:putative DNA modification/repair radical SAM protein [Variovorax sp. J22P168]MDM0011158.1 putative DNA modification/repair radical SAM protein [Variovorax sp. J22P168]